MNSLISTLSPVQICDFRCGCVLVSELFPQTFAVALDLIASNPHLADAFFQLSLTAYGKASIDMALAIQEARSEPPRDCPCNQGQVAALNGAWVT